MSEEMKYRHEYKYIVSEEMMAILRGRISGLVPIDSHVGSSGSYLIRSVYFDDCYNTCFFENEDGVDPREKMRIRIYNCSDQKITLECKRKESEKTLKTSCPLDKEDVLRLLDGSFLPDISNQHPVLRKLTLAMMERLMRPAVIVEYERTPYVYQLGNVRVTFDTNIVSSMDFPNFFSPHLVSRPVLPQGFHLLEVKFDEYIPDFIIEALALDGLERTAFSKYYLSRKYSLNNK